VPCPYVRPPCACMFRIPSSAISNVVVRPDKRLRKFVGQYRVSRHLISILQSEVVDELIHTICSLMETIYMLVISFGRTVESCMHSYKWQPTRACIFPHT
jgi:hypothetical protein